MSRLFCTPVLIGAMLCVTWTPSIQAGEPEAKQPYKLHVVLHFADNPALTATYFDRIERELGDSLQADFGDLVQVKVVRKHPWLRDVLNKGLVNALKTWTVRDGVKTHFVLIDFNGVDYEIQTGQYDGVTGQPNPVLVVERERTPIVRKEKRRDREFVAKTAAQMIERDFGLIAAFPAWPRGAKPQTVQLDFKGAALAPLDRWVKKGDVFAVVQVPNGNGTSQTIPDALVQVADAPGTASRRASFSRYALPAGGAVTYRCVKLGTVAGPLRMRIVKANAQKKTIEPVDIGLQVRRLGFTGEAQTLLKVDTRRGLFDAGNSKFKLGAAGQFENVAFVSVVEGVRGTVRAEVPVPLLTDQPVVIKLSDQKEADLGADLNKIAWTTNVNESFGRLEYIIKDIQKLATKEGTRRDDQEGRPPGNGAGRLSRTPGQEDQTISIADPRRKGGTKDHGQALEGIKTRIDELATFLAKQREIEQEEKDPERLEWIAKIEQGVLLEKDLEFGKALAIYEKVPGKFAARRT